VTEVVAVEVEPTSELHSWGWHLLQVSSWLLLILVPVHAGSIWLVHDAGRMGVAFYLERWHSGTWRIIDWLFFMLALAHGGLGLNAMAGSLIRDRRLRVGVAVMLGVTLGVLALALSATIFAFEVA